MNSIEIFNILKSLSSKYVYVTGFNVIRYDSVNEMYYADEMWSESNIFPHCNFFIKSFIEAFNEMDIEVNAEGAYSFEALIEFSHPDYNAHSDACYVEHIEWNLYMDINNYDKSIQELNDLDYQDLPF